MPISVSQPLVEESLSASLGSTVRLKKCSAYKKNRILRCWLAEGPSSLPEVFLVKAARETVAEPYERYRDVPGSSAWLLFNEWAALQFLSALPDDDMRGCPAFIAGDLDRGLIAFEYLPGTRTLRDVLRSSKQRELYDSLLAHAQTMGRLHGFSRGKRDEWTGLRSSLGHAHGLAEFRVDDFLPLLQKLANSVGEQVSPAIEVELEDLFSMLLGSEPLSVLLHADTAPQNYLWDGKSVKVVDFERCEYGFFSLDVPLGPLPFPVRWKTDAILAKELEQAYRAEFSRGSQNQLDDMTYYKGVLVAWVYWLLLGPVCRVDQQKSSGLQLLVQRCRAVTYLSREIGYLRQMGNLFDHIADRLDHPGS